MTDPAAGSSQPSGPPQQGTEQPKFPVILVMLLWSLSIASLGTWNYFQSYQASLQQAKAEARHSFAKDLTFRRWAASHGGVYVPVTDSTPPNPNLSHIPERDLTTPSGRLLTLINPAYMIRQLHETGDEVFGSRSHITSLQPLRPENAPDAWETRALKAFKRGATEWSYLPRNPEEDTCLRLMRPLRAEEDCLKCHGEQGYQVGDIIGGISVSIPWAPHRQALFVSLAGIVTGYGGVWLLGLILLECYRRSLRQHLNHRRQVEEALRLRTSELEEKSTELQRFTYTVSHDLRTPLVTIKSFLGFLEQDIPGAASEHIARDVEYIRSAANKMDRLLEELLEFSRIGRHANPPVRVSFRDLIAEVLSLTAGPVANHKVEVRVEPVDLVLFCDRSRMVEVWQNLVDNAVKFMGDQKTPRIEIGIEFSEDIPVFFVCDNGRGIDPSYHEKIFSLFERLDTDVAGTGLGLALVKKVVELNGGRIWVESTESGQGSCFRFTLPEASRETNPAGESR